MFFFFFFLFFFLNNTFCFSLSFFIVSLFLKRTKSLSLSLSFFISFFFFLSLHARTVASSSVLLIASCFNTQSFFIISFLSLVLFVSFDTMPKPPSMHSESLSCFQSLLNASKSMITKLYNLHQKQYNCMTIINIDKGLQLI